MFEGEGRMYARAPASVKTAVGGYARSMGKTPNVPTAQELPSHEPGDVVAIRELWDRRVWYAWPAGVVRDEPNLQMLHVPAHARCRPPVDAAGSQRMVVEGRGRAPGGRCTQHLHGGRRGMVPVLGRARSGARLAAGAAVRSGLVDVAPGAELGGRQPPAELGSRAGVITPCL